MIQVVQFNVVRGLPLRTTDIEIKIIDIIGGSNGKQ